MCVYFTALYIKKKHENEINIGCLQRAFVSILVLELSKTSLSYNIAFIF